MRLFSTKKRPVHMGPYPTERLKRGGMPDLTKVPPMCALSFHRPEAPESIVNAMCEYQAMLDAIRDGMINKAVSEIPVDPKERRPRTKNQGLLSPTQADERRKAGPLGPKSSAARLGPRGFSVGVVDSLGWGFVLGSVTPGLWSFFVPWT